MDRRIIRTLYKSKLGVARKMGYVYGDWNSHVKRCNPYNFNLNKITRIYKQRRIGHYMGNNIRNNYKTQMNVTDKNVIDDLIIDGFEALELVNWMKQHFSGR